MSEPREHARLMILNLCVKLMPEAPPGQLISSDSLLAMARDMEEFVFNEKMASIEPTPFAGPDLDEAGGRAARAAASEMRRVDAAKS